MGGQALADELWANRQLWQLDLATLTWQKRALMEDNRNYVSTVLLNGSIYAIGGNSGHLVHNTVERYDIAENRWFTAPNMRRKRSDAAAVVLNGTIYVMGGFDGFAPTSTMEQYSPGRKKWSMACSLSEKILGIVEGFIQKRRQMSSCCLGDRIYSIPCRASYFAPG